MSVVLYIRLCRLRATIAKFIIITKTFYAEKEKNN
jgi:hypothetical protein